MGHGAVAFACRRREPQSIDFDPSASIRSDSPGRAQIAHHERYRRSSHAENLQQVLLGERDDVIVDMVAEIEHQARHAGFDRMQRIAGRAELKLYQHRPDVNLDRVPDHGAPVESGMKSACGDPHARGRALLVAREDPPSGVSPDEAIAEVRDLLDSIADTCPECPPEAVRPPLRCRGWYSGRACQAMASRIQRTRAHRSSPRRVHGRFDLAHLIPLEVCFKSRLGCATVRRLPGTGR
jgi:hypothetical protein